MITQVKNGLNKNFKLLRKKAFPYKPLEVLGPEHEFSLVDEELRPLPISDQVIKDYLGRIADFVYLPMAIFGKEAALLQMEIKAKTPFKSPETFEETIQDTVTTLLEFIGKKHKAHLLGTGMHPTLTLEETDMWPHSNQDTIQELKNIFNLKRQGYLNIQSFQLNLPYSNEANAVSMYNTLTHLCAYLPALSASSPGTPGA